MEYIVTPILRRSCSPPREPEALSRCFPCLPRCSPSKCCPASSERAPKKKHSDVCCHIHYHSPTHSSTKLCQLKPPMSPQEYPKKSSRPPPCCRPSPDCQEHICKPVRTKYIMPCYRYEDGRIVRRFPASAFKRNGMQDQEHSKLLGAASFLTRCPRDVSVECDVCMKPVKKCDPVKVPSCPCECSTCSETKPLSCSMLRKKPVKVAMEDIIY